VIPLLYNLYLGSIEQNFYKDHNLCRLELIRLLKALQMNPHVASAFPIQYCLEISHMAARDIDLSIAQEAKLASAELEKIIHPAAPTLQLPRQQEPENEFSENQVEEVAASSRSDKRNRAEDLLQDADAILSLHKRPKITVRNVQTQCTEIIQKGNDMELIEENNSADMNKSQARDDSCTEIEEEETENVLQEQDKVQDKEQSQLDVIAVRNDTENKMECELDTHANTEKRIQCEQLEKSISTEESIRTVENGSESSAKIQKKVLLDDSEEELDTDVLNYLNLFHDEVKS